MVTGEQAPAAPSAERPTGIGRDVAWGSLAALVSVLAAAWKVGAPASLGGLWGHWDYTGYYQLARVLQTNPWTTPNYDLGFPWAQDLAHAPTPDVLHLLVLKVIVWVVQDPIVALNVFLTLGFGFVAIAMYALLRVLRVTPGISFALAVSFSLLPWHFDRLIHAFLSNYSSVPVGLVLLIAVLSWPLALSGPERGRPRDQIIALGLAVYVGLSGGYYAVFISILALTTLTFQILAGRRGRSLIPAVWLGILPVAISQAASMGYRLLAVTDPPSNTALARLAEESQSFGGAFFTLLRTTGIWTETLPIPGLSLVPVLTSPLEGDARNSTIGVVAVVAALVVSGVVLLRNGEQGSGRVAALGYWPLLFMSSVLFFVTSGFGQTFSILFMYQVRSWGRFAIVVIAIAIAILALLLNRWLDGARQRRALTAAVVVAILATTALDLVTSSSPVQVERAQAEADELRAYGSDIDEALEPGCGVFELPAQPFPEGVPTDGTATYDPMLPYLFSSSARWSYGGIKGTQAGDWHLHQVSRDVPTLTAQVKAAGFCAIQVDSAAYAGGDSPVASLSAALGDPIAASSTGRWLLYSLARASTGPYSREYVLDPVNVSYGFGFAVPDPSGSDVSAELGGTDGTLFVTNPRDTDLAGIVQFTVQGSGCPDAVEVTATGQGRSVSATVTGVATAVLRLPFTARPGQLGVVHVTAVNPCTADDTLRLAVVNTAFVPE